MSRIEPKAQVYLADKADFERMKDAMISIGRNNNIRNAAAIFAKMLDIVEQHFKDEDAKKTNV